MILLGAICSVVAVAARTEVSRQARVLSMPQRFQYGPLSHAQKMPVIRCLPRTSG